MSSTLGNKLRVTVFGQSHAEAVGVVIDGLPAGEAIDLDLVQHFLLRRAGGQNAYSTARREDDTPHIISGLANGVTCGAPLCALFENKNVRSADYSAMQNIPRPSHADWTAFVKHRGFEDRRGGGHFSGRLTLPLCFAGAVCMQLLGKRGVHVGAHIHSIADVRDTPFDLANIAAEDLCFDGFPARNPDAAARMIAQMEEAAKAGDSIGGVIECAATGFPAGLGDPMFDTLEGRLSYALFGIPAIKGVEFGAGFAGVAMPGSQYNDALYAQDGGIRTRTNHAGGILGGISNGMPIVFRVLVKPTPSIAMPQQSVNLKTGEAETLVVKGRHDPCIVPRAVPCVEAACAVTLYDILLGG